MDNPILLGLRRKLPTGGFLYFFTTQERTFLVSHSHCITSDTYLGEGDPVYNTQTLQIDKNKKNV